MVASSSSAPEFSYPQNPSSSGDALSPSTTSSTSHSLPPPPPLEPFGYPHGCFPEEAEEDGGDHQRSSEDVEFDSSEPIRPHPRATVEPETEFKHFANMATVFQTPTVHPLVDDRRIQQHAAVVNYDPSMDEASDQRYGPRHFDHVPHHSSSSSNSFAISPTEVYPVLGNNNNNVSRSVDSSMDYRQSAIQPSTLFQQVCVVSQFNPLILLIIKDFN